MTANEVEKLEEAKLKAKFPVASGFPLSGHSAFLQKKLAKGVSISSIRYLLFLEYKFNFKNVCMCYHLYILSFPLNFKKV